MGCSVSAHDVHPFSECAVTALSSDDGRGRDAATTSSSPAAITFTTSPWSEGNSTWTTPMTSGSGARPVSGSPHNEVAETATRVHDDGSDGNEDNDAALRSSSSTGRPASAAFASAAVPALDDDDDIGENALLPVSAASAVTGWATADDAHMSASNNNNKHNSNSQNPLIAPMRVDVSTTHSDAAQRAPQRLPQPTAGAHVVAPLHTPAEEAPTTEVEAEAGWDPSSFGAMLFSDSGIADDRSCLPNRPRTASATGHLEGSGTVLYNTREDAVLRRSPSVLTPTRSPVPSSILLGSRLLSADTLSRSPHGSRTNSNVVRSPRVLASPSGSSTMPQQQQHHRGSSSTSITAKRRRTTSASALLV